MTDPRKNGVRDPRPVDPPPKRLVDPRIVASRDLIALERRLLSPRRGLEDVADPKGARIPSKLRDAAKTSAKTYRELIGKAPEGPAAAAGKTRDADANADLPMFPYRYTKGPDITNDEMGYGERLEELFYVPTENGGLEPFKRLSQRTKSGRQVLDVGRRGRT